VINRRPCAAGKIWKDREPGKKTDRWSRKGKRAFLNPPFKSGLLKRPPEFLDHADSKVLEVQVLNP